MKNQKVVFVSFLVLALFITSCQPTAPSVDLPQNGGIDDVRVNTAAPTEAKISTEEFPLPNCGGTGEIRQTLGATASVFKSVTIGVKATARGGGEVALPETAKLKLEIEVEGAYQKTYESASSRLDTIDMPAAAGTHVVYWTLAKKHSDAKGQGVCCPAAGASTWLSQKPVLAHKLSAGTMRLTRPVTGPAAGSVAGRVGYRQFSATSARRRSASRQRVRPDAVG